MLGNAFIKNGLYDRFMACVSEKYVIENDKDRGWVPE